ncbi:hypothetical protein WL57_16290 [Burkholderia cepacia]|nr:hypothetical protein WL57_16290 [Burkholderia cepacia]
MTKDWSKPLLALLLHINIQILSYVFQMTPRGFGLKSRLLSVWLMRRQLISLRFLGRYERKRTISP